MLNIAPYKLAALKRSEYYPVFAELSEYAQWEVFLVCEKLVKELSTGTVNFSLGNALEFVCKQVELLERKNHATH